MAGRLCKFFGEIHKGHKAGRLLQCGYRVKAGTLTGQFTISRSEGIDDETTDLDVNDERLRLDTRKELN